MKLYTYTKGSNDYTVIGSPTIVNGVVSGFSSSNYLTMPNINTKYAVKTVEFCFCLNNVGATGSGYRQYFSMTNFSLCISNGGGVGVNYSGSSYYNWNTPPATGDVYIITKIDIPNNIFTISWTVDQITYKTSQHTPSTNIELDSIINIGKGGIGAIEKIDMSKSYIKINDNIWFGKGFGRVNLFTRLPGSVNYTIVGSPTINNNIVSEFSNSNYLKFNNFNAALPFELRAKFKTTQIGQRQVIFGAGTSGVIRFILFTDGKIQCNLGTSTSSFNIGSLYSDVVFTTNTDYWVVLKFTGSKYIMSYSTDGITFIELDSINSTSLINNGNDFELRMGLGVIGSVSTYLSGSIDLNETYININNMPWFGRSSGKTKIFLLSGYIQGTGTQYIDTGFKANQNTRVICKFSPGDIPTSQFIFSSRTNYNSSEFGFGIVNSVFRDTWNTGAIDSGITPIIGQIYTADKNKNKTYLDSELIQTNTSSTFSSTRNLMLFCSPGATPANFYKGKIYNVQIYDNGTLIRDLSAVPQGLVIGNYTVPSNGMWDKLNNAFYPNAGSGTFTYGVN